MDVVPVVADVVDDEPPEVVVVVPLDPPFTTVSTTGFQLGSIDIRISAGSMANILLPQILDVSTVLIVGVVIVDVDDCVDVPSDAVFSLGVTVSLDMVALAMVDVVSDISTPFVVVASSLTKIDVVILLPFFSISLLLLLSIVLNNIVRGTVFGFRFTGIIIFCHRWL